MARVGGVDRVTGAQLYAGDLKLNRPLHVKLVHLPCARARLRAIDVANASRVDGVRRILTAADMPVPPRRFGPIYTDRPALAFEETKFFGEPVAAVAAETEDAAETGAAEVRVDYEELPGILNIDDALDPAAPLVQAPELRANDPHANSNILNEWHFGWGDLPSARAHCVVENEYSFPLVTHFAIEPHVFMAEPDADGITIWSSIQHPYVLQRVVAEFLDWPISKIRVIAPDPGGGFGGKGWPKFEPLMAYLALLTKRAVRLVLTLEETFQAVRRAAARVRIRTGFAPDGNLVFQDIESDFLLGAYADIGPRVVSKASYVACGPYITPNARIRARALLSHTTPSTAFRGFGTPQASWAVESQMDEAAAILGIDRVEIRRRNLPAKGQEFIPNDTPADGNWSEALSKAAACIHWGSALPRNRGRGISLGLKSSATASVSFAMARLHADGSASIMTGTSDMGQGARTVFTQMAASELGIPADRIRIVMGDTAMVPFDSSTSASRSTVFMGNAILKACLDIKVQLRRLAGELLNVPEDSVIVSQGTIRAPGHQLSFPQLLHLYYGSSRGEVMSIGSARSASKPDHPLGGNPSFWETMCVAVEVEVDPETGMVEIPKLVLVSDVGKALNPLQVETQDEGSAIMGIGHTLMEHLLLDEHGCIRNLGALDYRIPTIQDIPHSLESILIENGDGPGPFGAKGAGEGGLLSIAAAIGAAVYEATGARIRDLPLTPEKIWRAMQEVRNRPEEQHGHV